MSEKTIIIVAPHPDDEIIGCFEVVSNYKTMILYDSDTPQLRREEAMKLKDKFDINMQVFMVSIPQPWLTIPNAVFFFPDPIYEVHPVHRRWGQVGEMMARAGHNVVFYNTIMNAPYIHEVINFHEKKKALDVFESQKNMWKWDHKYFLFEGYTKWCFSNEIMLG